MLDAEGYFIKNNIIRLFIEYEYLHLEDLAQKLSISLMDVESEIAQLQLLGINIIGLNENGYELVGRNNFLLENKISAFNTNSLPRIEVQNIVDSTNTQLLSRLTKKDKFDNGYSLVADLQICGKGSRGRKWFSPLGASLSFSMYWMFEQGVKVTMGLSLVVAIVLVRVLEKDYQIAAKIKWPNDIYINNKKVSGILVELNTKTDGACEAIIGLGINLNLPDHIHDVIEQEITDLKSFTTSDINPNKLAVLIQQELCKTLIEFQSSGFSLFIDEFNHYDQFYGKQIKLIGKEELKGIDRGVNEQGALLFEDEMGLKPYYSGELSLRAVN